MNYVHHIDAAIHKHKSLVISLPTQVFYKLRALLPTARQNIRAEDLKVWSRRLGAEDLNDTNIFPHCHAKCTTPRVPHLEHETASDKSMNYMHHIDAAIHEQKSLVVSFPA